MAMKAISLLALAAAASACDLNTLSTQTAAMDAKCCAANNCKSGGVPTKCTKACAPAFAAFWKDCGSYLQYLPGTETMKEFADKCEGQKVDKKDSDKASCDAGTLLTTMFFTCAKVDQNDAKQFCGSKCHDGVQDYVKRCKKTETAATKNIFNQATAWLKNCGNGNEDLSCHAVDCHGHSEAECAKADDRASCAELSAKANNVFCRWQHCKHSSAGPPPPPAPKRAGCTDPKAINYDSKAQVMAPGSCLYKHDKPPPPPTATTQCSHSRYYYCHTKTDCEGQKLQWVSCEEMIKYGRRCYGTSQKAGGSCSLPCSATQTYNCHTAAKCASAGGSWYQPAPYKPGAKPPAPRCERKCSTKSRYTCRTEAACNSIGMQWVDGPTYHDATGKVTRKNPGRCDYKCDAKHYSSCHTKVGCEALKGHQWVPSTCCGAYCSTPGKGQDNGSCQAPCSVTRSYQCHSEIACEAVGKQWVLRPPPPPSPAGSKCATAASGYCQYVCTQDRYDECKTKAACEAIGMEWRPPVEHEYKLPNGQMHKYTQPGRCDYACTLANPNSCDSKDECVSIGYNWQPIKYTKPPTDPKARKGYCSEPCYDSNPNGCLTEKECTENNNAWIIEPVRHYCRPGSPDCGIIIDPGFGGHGGRDRRMLQTKPKVEMRGRCIESCKKQDIYACRTKKTCEDPKVGGVWQPRPNAQPNSPTGFCRNGCSPSQSYMCKTAHACNHIGGKWSHNRCDTKNAPCDISMFLSVCGASGGSAEQGVQLCDNQCGRFIMNNYDRCSKKPPAGMNKAQWQEHFGPIVSMCKSYRKDPSLSRCARMTTEATETLNKVCCTKDTQCEANHGAPTKCTGHCADVFLPFFETCGAILLGGQSDQSALGRLYKTCTATGKAKIQDPKLCHANNGNAPFVAIEFRDRCSLWVQYVLADDKSKKVSPMMRLVGVGPEDGGVSTDTLLDNAKTFCGDPDMVKRLAEDFSGILALSKVAEKGNTLRITVNDPVAGNTEVVVTNTPQNRAKVAKTWKKKYKYNVFNPDKCGR